MFTRERGGRHLVTKAKGPDSSEPWSLSWGNFNYQATLAASPI